MLHEISDWKPGISCTPIALAAVTGRTISQVTTALRAGAAHFGVGLGEDVRPDYDMNHWLRALKVLGCEYTDQDFSQVQFDARTPIEEWISNAPQEGAYIVMCTDSDLQTARGHVFAYSAGFISDTFTEGKPARLGSFPPEFPPFRVKYVFRVRCG